MEYTHINALNILFLNNIQILDQIKEAKYEAARAKMFGEDKWAEMYLKNENKLEDVLIQNMTTIAMYIKKNMDGVSEAHAGLVLDLVS